LLHKPHKDFNFCRDFGLPHPFILRAIIMSCQVLIDGFHSEHLTRGPLPVRFISAFIQGKII
jgi:hypothetical protein